MNTKQRLKCLVQGHNTGIDSTIFYLISTHAQLSTHWQYMYFICCFTPYELLISIKTSFESSLFIWIHRRDEKQCISDLDLHCFQKRV